MVLQKLLIVLACGAVQVIPQNVYMRRATLEDQATAATGYFYSTDSNGPAKYLRFTDTSGQPENFGHPPITLGHYPQTLHAAPAGVQYLPQLNSYTQPLLDINHGLASVDNEASKYGFAKQSGEKYDASKHSANGEKGEEGQKSLEAYEKGSQGKHDKEEQKGHYSDEGSNKEGHHEVSDHYASKNEAAKGSEGGSYGESNSHKKGSKTTGYHKVYHKDEYKKDHTFYDEADNNGHFNKYGGENSYHSSEDGGSNKGGHSDGSYHDDSHGKKGSYDRGHYLDNDKGFKGETAENEYYRDHSDYAKNGGHQSDRKHEYNDGEGHKYIH